MNSSSLYFVFSLFGVCMAVLQELGIIEDTVSSTTDSVDGVEDSMQDTAKPLHGTGLSVWDINMC